VIATSNGSRRGLLGFAVAAGWLILPQTAWGQYGTVPVLDEAFQAQLDAETHSRRYAGCDARLLIDGPAAYQAFKDLVNDATDHIHVETLVFEINEYGRDSASLFAEAALRGLEVRLIVDPFYHFLPRKLAMLNFIEESGGEYRFYWKHGTVSMERVKYRLHKKILLADGREAILGGMNYGTRYFAEDAWRDTNILVTGPVVKDIREEFLQDWIEVNGWRDGVPDLTRYYPPLEPTGPGEIRNVDQRPAHDDLDINRLVELLIDNATRRVVIETAYFIPNDRVKELLANAVKRGVDVTVMTNGRSSNDLGDTLFLPSLLTFSPMLDAGVEILLWEAGFEHTMHAKTLLIDDAVAIVGSYNMSNRSYRWDSENVVVLTEPGQVAAVREMLATDLGQAWIVHVDRRWFKNVSALDWIRAFFVNLLSRHM